MLLITVASVAVAASATAVAVAAAPPAPKTSPTSAPHAVAPPPAGARFDYQLGGAYPPAEGVRIVDRDRTDRPVRGVYSICYVNAFQTQPQERAWWLRHHPTLVLRTGAGKPVVDPGWPGEAILDISTAAKRRAVARIVNRWVDGCAAKGFRAIEPDNLDTWTRFPKRISRADTLAYTRLLTAHAHRRGLAVAQKNAPELGRRGEAAGFDFAIAEECQVYEECGAYTAVYGRHVIEIEYTDTPRRAFSDGCRLRGSRVSVLLRDREVVPRGTAGYVSRWCR
ncbi:hypothetical protein D1781_09845 [Amnibacterium setariae]|uniref:Glycoside-hydrolase family GH114 TIM-barrel domain-containing protein n=1 Tax=Amnibacterium setariae TaxID=2306585 RepID=A0A3A1U1X7_9MICO|nr:hypothetical protein D1781_09845 [Amnibacterium setariae]